MPSYDELDNEIWWRSEFEPPPLAAFNARCRAHWNLTRSLCGSKGDNKHVRGRHRSRNWVLNSRYCTNRSYAATDARDKRGPGNALRATDIGITGVVLREVCARLDAAVRAGVLPQVAEWFGTVNGSTVVGWSNGRPLSSDDSHLYHLHIGYWTEATEDTEFFLRLFDILTDGDDMDVVRWTTGWLTQRLTEMADPIVIPANPAISYPGYTAPNLLAQELRAIRAAQTTPAQVDIAALAAALVPHMEAAAEAAVRKVLGAVDEDKAA